MHIYNSEPMPARTVTFTIDGTMEEQNQKRWVLRKALENAAYEIALGPGHFALYEPEDEDAAPDDELSEVRTKDAAWLLGLREQVMTQFNEQG